MKSRRIAALRLPLILVVFIGGSLLSGIGRGHASIARAQAPGFELVAGTVAVDAAIERAVVSALTDAAALFSTTRQFAITDVRLEPGWSIVSVIGLGQLNEDRTWGLDDGSWYGVVLLEQTAGNEWRAAVQGTPEFSTLLAGVPEAILGRAAKLDLDPRQSPAAPLGSTYVFPWPAGSSMFYGQGGVHPNGFIDGWVAVDMLSDGNTAAGHAPNRLLAADAGTIEYKCTDANNVAIQQGSFFYTHLANNTRLFTGRSFAQGEEMGQLKTGTFGTQGTGCGWTSQPANWFHVHWGFPNVDLSVDNWTLDVSAETWTDGDVTVGPDDFGWIPAGATAELHFAVIGDYGSGDVAEADVADLVKSWDPDLVLTVGDNNYPAGEASTIDDHIGQFYSEFIYPYTGSHEPAGAVNRFFPVLGNHDWDNPPRPPGNADPYLQYFTLPEAYPGNERYYDFIRGPVHFFMLDSDGREPDGNTVGSAQALWLQSALAASVSPWKIVVLHHAPYSSGPHHSTAALQWPFADWGADAVLAGHDHTYERIHRDGILYFVNGVGGKSLYDFGAPVAGSQRRYNSNYGAMQVNATASELVFRFITRSGTEQDMFRLPAPARPRTVGINSSSGWYFLRNSNSSGPADLTFQFGWPSATPLVGDWNGDGTTTVGVESNAWFFLRNSNTAGPADVLFKYGWEGATPLIGDWDGNGTATVGIASGGWFFLRNSNSPGPADTVFSFGWSGAEPVVGDWDGDGVDTVGIYEDGTFYLRNANSAGPADLTFGYGPPAAVPIVGDWDGNGTDTVGIYSGGTFFLRNANTPGPADLTFGYGWNGAEPLSGDWDGAP